MKLPRLITRRRLKWTGLVLCVLVLVVYVASAWCWVSCWPVNKPKLFVNISVGAGCLAFAAFEPDAPPKVGARSFDALRFGLLDNPSIDLWPTLPQRDTYITPDSDPPFTLTEVSLPLWLPLLLIAAPTAWLWHTDRRAKPWQCAKCRYDLRGLDGVRDGVCPECGRAYTQSNAEAVGEA